MMKNRSIEGAAARTKTMDPAAPCIGRIAGMDPDSRILVRYHQGRCNPARLVAGLNRFELSTDAYADKEVLLTFLDGDPDRPVIVALMSDPLEELACLAADLSGPRELHVDDETVVIEAQREILLKCGQCSILMRKDGKIVLKGVEIVTRASRTNKIKGACVKVN